jgi:hypothetical protein
MNFKLYVLAAAFIMFTITGCVDVAYHGGSFQPTKHVIFFYDQSSYPKDKYKITGKATVTADSIISGDTINDKLFEKARQKGVDAVVILDLGRKQAKDCCCGHNDEDEQEHEHHKNCSSKDVKYGYKKEVKALFLKRKDRLPSPKASKTNQR